MATQTRTATTAEPEIETVGTGWRGGVAAGALAGIAMGAAFSLFAPAALEVAIPSLYGLSGGLAGWIVHVSHGAVLGVGFVALANALGVVDPTRSTLLGVGYGVALWAVLAALVMPAWLAAVGSPATPPLPNLDTLSLAAHVLYGAVLGAALPSLRSL
ncbi:histidine kinase [Halobaculum magnesiiphilum]|uniref:Histidine kinase n=1 Tax=Halobaculum magnesiiphilum TaxID=1017351 RepID=A0A8T8W9Z9_9EURY|nr:histidine kinase [Halobaculum magnesiiphilum]QZP36660.1 histidine kinase [Halobaculum magnesiiphilum]